MVNIPLFTRFHACWVVQDFFHQHYKKNTGFWPCLSHFFLGTIGDPEGDPFDKDDVASFLRCVVSVPPPPPPGHWVVDMVDIPPFKDYLKKKHMMTSIFLVMQNPSSGKICEGLTAIGSPRPKTDVNVWWWLEFWVGRLESWVGDWNLGLETCHPKIYHWLLTLTIYFLIYSPQPQDANSPTRIIGFLVGGSLKNLHFPLLLGLVGG